MLTPAQVAQFQKNGYIKSTKVLTDAQVDVLRAELERVMTQKDNPEVQQPVSISNWNPKAPIWQIVNIWEASAAFREVMSHPTIVEEVAQITGAKELRIWHDQIQYKPASEGGVNMWHQDWPYWPTITPLTDQVSAWIALDDVDESNGCMSMVPGSHTWGNCIEFLHTIKDFKAMPKQYKEHAIEVLLAPVKKGEVHYHHGLTWHGSHANTSGRPRRAIAYHYMTERTCFVASGNHIMKPFIEVADGAQLKGEHFPLVWDGAKAVPAPAVRAKAAAR
ncbi:MAG: phytanoyl-CoA dioxygenase family protein [Planctomycetota bacterium]|nr:phytanoyl-CoA dioxygenase family protein [Planctomycetota bacterium]